jgi:hypothetical protein
MATKFSETFAISMLKKHRKFCRRGLTHLDATPTFKNRPNTYETYITGYIYIFQINALSFIGIRTGSSKVSVRLASKSYSDVPPAEVTVMVVANLFLVPNFAFVMNGATVHYHAERSLSESNGVSLFILKIISN